MKKMIASKRGRRFDEGGEVEDKRAGLESSNKEPSVGFFERLRMGNIDDPSSEAYKRFGAGRGRADRIPVADVTPTPVMRNKPMEAMVASAMDDMEAANAREPIKVEAGPRSEPMPQARKPVMLPPKVKETRAKAEYDPTAGEAKDKKAQEAADAINDFPKAASESKPATSAKQAPIDVTKLSLAERAKLSRDKAKSGSKTDVRSVNERMRSAFGMKSGGSVSKASSRADGIAQRGKTRGKMC